MVVKELLSGAIGIVIGLALIATYHAVMAWRIRRGR